MHTQLPRIPQFLESPKELELNNKNSEFEVIEQEDPKLVEQSYIKTVECEITEIPVSTNEPKKSDALDWKSLLQTKKYSQDLISTQKNWGQLNDMLHLNAPETKWTSVCFGTTYLSPNLFSHAYHLLKNLINSGQWHSPERAEVLLYRWNNLPAIKISWKKTELPPFFFEEDDDVEILVQQQSGNEILNIFETNLKNKTGQET